MIRITPQPLIFALYQFCFLSMKVTHKSYSNGAYSEAVNTNLSALQIGSILKGFLIFVDCFKMYF